MIIQVSVTKSGVTLHIDVEGLTFTTFDVYAKKDSAPDPLTDTPVSAGVSGNLRSIALATPSSNGVWFYIVVGNYGGTKTQSATDFILYNTTLTYRSDIKAAIFNRLKLTAELTALVTTNIFAGFPQSLPADPCVIYFLEQNDVDVDKQYQESITLRVRGYARNQSTLDAIVDYINQGLINYSYQGKEAVIYSIKKFSETGLQLESDGMTLSNDMFFRVLAERLTLPKIS